MNSKNKFATHCPAKHSYTPVNTYINPSGARDCRECDRLRWRLKHKAKIEYNSYYKRKFYD